MRVKFLSNAFNERLWLSRYTAYEFSVRQTKHSSRLSFCCFSCSFFFFSFRWLLETRLNPRRKNSQRSARFFHSGDQIHELFFPLSSWFPYSFSFSKHFLWKVKLPIQQNYSISLTSKPVQCSVQIKRGKLTILFAIGLRKSESNSILILYNSPVVYVFCNVDHMFINWKCLSPHNSNNVKVQISIDYYC